MNDFTVKDRDGILYKMTTERRFGQPSSEDYIDNCSSEPIFTFKK